MLPCLPFQNSRILAHAVKKEMNSQGIGKISPRPWNFRDPDHTLW
jgi:hypothetical protein